MKVKIARDRSPHLRREGEFIRFLMEPDARPVVPADPATLRAIRDEILDILSLNVGKLMAHAVSNRLGREADHYLGVHLMGYEFNESGALDDDMERWQWRTGLGSYSSNPLSPWTTDISRAAHLARYLCPDLRVRVTFGGRDHGLPERARFSRKAAVPGLAGREVPLPADWPKWARSHPAAAVVCALLEALAVEKEAAAAGATAAAA